jgi:hypothetical protein
MPIIRFQSRQWADPPAASCRCYIHSPARRRHQIPIAPVAPPVPNFPRLRALALFGRRPPQHVDRPASRQPKTSTCVCGSGLARAFFTFCSIGRCSHVFGLLMRFTGPLAIMPSADQVPVNKAHSTMRWHEWVVLIAGSTGSALRAVRPPNLHITPVIRRDLVIAQVRRVPCIACLWPSWPRPSALSCWQARRLPLWPASAPAGP